MIRLLLLFSLSFSLQAQRGQIKRDILTYLKSDGETSQKKWKLKIRDLNGYDHIELYKKYSKLPLLSYSAELVSHAFNRAYLIIFNNKNFLVTLWDSGSHGEEVLIFDLNDKKPKPVWFYVSSWPVKLTVSKKQMTIKGSGDMDEMTGIPKVQIKKWNPSMKPMDLSMDGEASIP